MLKITTVGLDLAKNAFQLHGADATGRAMPRRKLRRGQVFEFLAGLPSCAVAMEACGGALYRSTVLRQETVLRLPLCLSRFALL